MKSICWNITTRCNAKCKFCNRMENAEELDYELNKKILYELYECGISKITWTGGEALLYKGLSQLIKFSKELGIKNHLITNGLALTEQFLEETDGCLNYITLSLDSCDSVTNAKLGRFNNQFDIVRNRIALIKKIQKDCKIKINTIACAINLKDILEVGNSLLDLEVDRWNIFRFNEFRGTAKINAADYNIMDKQYQELRFEVLKSVVSMQYSNDFVEFLDNDSLEENYILIRADGAVVITRDEIDIILGNLNLESLVSLLSKNRKYFCATK